MNRNGTKTWLTVERIVEDLDKECNISFGVFSVKYDFHTYDVSSSVMNALLDENIMTNRLYSLDGDSYGVEFMHFDVREAKKVAESYSRLSVDAREIFLKMIEGVEIDG